MRMMSDVKRGQPTEDELSHRIKQKAAESAFTFSFYCWMTGTHLFCGLGCALTLCSLKRYPRTWIAFHGILLAKGYLMQTKIKELRARHQITREELAKRVNVRRETIVFLEKGKYNPSLQLAYDLAKVFRLKIEEVFLMEDEIKRV